MILPALAAALAIVVQDHASLRTEPRSGAAEIASLWQGDVVEIRGQRAEYLSVYNYRRERGGYLRPEVLRPVGISEADAPELLAVLRFLRESRGTEALAISYGAAYLRAVSPRVLTAEPFDAIGRTAERLADALSADPHHAADLDARVQVVEQFGVHLYTFERNNRIQVCYDGELFRRILSLAQSSPEERANAVLGLTRPDCIDPTIGPVLRASVDQQRGELLDRIDERKLTAVLRSRVHARRAGVWAAIAFEQARRDEPSRPSAERAVAELLAVHPNDLGDDRRPEYIDAVMRVSAIRWATVSPIHTAGGLTLRATPGAPGQTCVALMRSDHMGGAPRQSQPGPLAQRCTYGLVWLASAQSISEGESLALAVQPLESWRELWIFHELAGQWTLDVLSPGSEDPEEGYIEFAGYVPATRRVLIAREVKEHGRYRRWFEERRIDDLALIRQASSPELLRDFGRWQDVTWRKETLALH